MHPDIRSAAAEIISDDVEIPTSGIRMPAFRAKPAGGAGFPVVIVVHDMFGLDEHIRELCFRLAGEGYLAVAPDLYVRQGDVQGIPDVQQIMSKVVSKVADAQVIADLDATVRWAKTEGDAARLAMTGYGWGGRIVWLYAGHSKQLKAGAVWYGRLVGNKATKAPVIGFYGAKDTSIPLSSVEKMRNVIESPSKIVIYEGADHAFNAEHRQTYNERAATDAWRRMLEFFRENLK